ncbi:14543_t:CDS:1 [Dentiscutata heterogama]|uniref:14543_t:CDS:1 n=1 Tax=Dentiscutata heterogama TaxID=1316150 RepID=A0ACA9MUC5_9GLOM|nr:14543_t:CDS:1 [Dentiscutata heterogama]
MVQFPYFTEIIAEIQNSANKLKQHIIDNPEIQNFANKVKENTVDNPEVQNFASKVRENIVDNPEVQNFANKVKQTIVEVRENIVDNPEVQNFANKAKQQVVDNQLALEKIIIKSQKSVNKARQHFIDIQPELIRIFTEPTLKKVVGSLAIGYLIGEPIIYGLLYVIGFRKIGISKYSTAAWLMSFHGGATPPGGIVANSQSAGAGGLRFVGKILTTLVGGAFVFYAISAAEAINILCKRQ